MCLQITKQDVSLNAWQDLVTLGYGYLCKEIRNSAKVPSMKAKCPSGYSKVELSVLQYSLQ